MDNDGLWMCSENLELTWVNPVKPKPRVFWSCFGSIPSRFPTNQWSILSYNSTPPVSSVGSALLNSTNKWSSLHPDDALARTNLGLPTKRYKVTTLLCTLRAEFCTFWYLLVNYDKRHLENPPFVDHFSKSKNWFSTSMLVPPGVQKPPETKWQTGRFSTSRSSNVSESGNSISHGSQRTKLPCVHHL